MRFRAHFKLRRPRQVNLNPSFVWLWDNRAGSAADTLVLARADRGAQRDLGGCFFLNVEQLYHSIHWTQIEGRSEWKCCSDA